MTNREWVIVNPDGRKNTWSEDWQSRFRHNFPEPDEYGLLWLDEFPYVLDPNAGLKENFRPPIFKAGILGIVIGLAFLAYPGGAFYGGPLAFASLLAVLLGFRATTWDTYFWRQNEPSPIYMNDPRMTPGSVGITGDTIRKYAKSKHLERLTQNDINYWPIIAILLAVGLIVAVVLAYYK